MQPSEPNRLKYVVGHDMPRAFRRCVCLMSVRLSRSFWRRSFLMSSIICASDLCVGKLASRTFAAAWSFGSTIASKAFGITIHLVLEVERARLWSFFSVLLKSNHPESFGRLRIRLTTSAVHREPRVHGTHRSLRSRAVCLN